MTDLNKIPELKNIPVDRLIELAKADKEGKLLILTQELALSMKAGARAIVKNNNLRNTEFWYNISGNWEESLTVQYDDAATNLYRASEKFFAKKFLEGNK